MSSTVSCLLESVKELWPLYNEHPFVLGIQNGDLPPDKFRYYILQDYLYLKDYNRCFGLGLAKAQSPETAALFSGYIRALTEGEMDIHRGYLGRLGVTQAELDATPQALDSLSYTSYMLRVSYEEGEAEVLTAILACACSYERIAKTILQRNPAAADHPFYGEWVRGYASQAYAQENALLLSTLDQLTAQYTEAQVKHLCDIFVTCSRYELAFWELSWNRKP